MMTYTKLQKTYIWPHSHGACILIVIFTFKSDPILPRIMKTRIALPFIVTLLLTPLPVWESNAQRPGIPSPEEVIELLVSKDHATSFSGIDGYLSLSPDQRTPEVNSALIKALDNEIKRIRRIELSEDDSVPMYTSEGAAERALALVEEVYKLRDPATIPVLLPWCGPGDAMVDFGRQAFEPVLRFVEAPLPGITRHQIGNCLYTLRMMVDYWGLDTFSTLERQRMKQVSTRYIVGSDFFLMDDAIRLSASIRESALLQMANILVNDNAEMAKREILDRKWLERLQETASQALAGTLKERQYVPYEERRERRY